MKKEILFWLGVGCLGIVMYKFIDKQTLILSISQHLPAREAGLMAGMLWGDKSGFSKDFYGLLQSSGIVHLVVVSGTNVMLVATLVIENMAYLVSRKRAIIIGSTLVWWYAVMVGLDPPVLRASLLLSIFYGAQFFGRKFDIWRALILVIVMMIMIDWRMLTGASFWLSLLAFVGVITVKRLQILNSKFLMKIPIVSDFLTTFWISIWVTPVLALVFGKISLIGPIVNGLVIGGVEMITIFGILGMIFWPILWLSYPMLNYIVRLVEMTGNWQWSVMEIGFNWWMLVGWYLILIYFLIKDKTPLSYGHLPLKKGDLKARPVKGGGTRRVGGF